VERSKRNAGRISVFKGREARLNYAVFHFLALKGPLTIYEVCKEVKTQKGLKHTKYTNVNRRIRALEQSGYLEKIGTRRTQAGFQAAIYQVSFKGYLALRLKEIDIEELLQVDAATIISLLGNLFSSEFKRKT